MNPDEFRSFYPRIIAWIERTLQAHERDKRPVASLRFARLPKYFSARLLVSTYVVVVDEIPKPPLSSMGLSRFADFEHGNADGITYLNTFFVKRGSAAVERLHFHELIHVVQWDLLGPEVFLAAYAAGLESFGYRDSPLERMAYDAEDTFVRSALPFEAERLVAERLGAIRDSVSVK